MLYIHCYLQILIHLLKAAVSCEEFFGYVTGQWKCPNYQLICRTDVEALCKLLHHCFCPNLMHHSSAEDMH